jgi:Domain of unknown function (DUF4397)
MHSSFALTGLRGLFAAIVLALGLSTGLTACGGGDDDDDGQAQVRVLNATADVTSIDITLESSDEDIDENVHAAAVGLDRTSDYAGVTATTYTVRLKRAGGNTTLVTYGITAEEDKHYTVVAFGREGRLGLAVLTDEERDDDEPDAGRARVRVFNASIDAGTVDVYWTDNDALLDEVTPTVSGLAGGTIGYYNETARGSYRLRVTGRDEKSDLRLDIPEIDLEDRGIVTVVLQPTPGGVLVNAVLLPERGAPSARKIEQARVRLVAGATDNGAVTAEIGGTSVNVNLRSPSVGSYVLVPAGQPQLTVRVNSQTIVNATTPLSAGGDYSLLVHGLPSAPSVKMLTDDNRLPNNSSKAKMRLVHAVHAIDSNLTLAKDYVSVSNDVPYGFASVSGQVDPASDARLEVTSPLFTNPLYLNDEAVLVTGGAYTVFMLGAAAQPTGILRRDR